MTASSPSRNVLRVYAGSRQPNQFRPSRCQFEEWCKLRGCLELGDWVEVFECARERIRETLCRSRSEFLDRWIEIEVVDAPGQMLGNVQLTLYERPIDNEFCGLGRNPRALPSLDLLLHRFEIPLNPVDSDGEHIDEAECLVCASPAPE